MSLQQCFVYSKVVSNENCSKERCICFKVRDPAISVIRVEHKRGLSRFNAAKRREVNHPQGSLQHSIFRMRKGTEASQSLFHPLPSCIYDAALLSPTSL